MQPNRNQKLKAAAKRTLARRQKAKLCGPAGKPISKLVKSTQATKPLLRVAYAPVEEYIGPNPTHAIILRPGQSRY